MQVAALRADAGQQVAHQHLQLLCKLERALHMMALRVVSTAKVRLRLSCFLRGLGRVLLRALMRASRQPGSIMRRCEGSRGSESQQPLPQSVCQRCTGDKICPRACAGAEWGRKAGWAPLQETAVISVA